MGCSPFPAAGMGLHQHHDAAHAAAKTLISASLSSAGTGTNIIGAPHTGTAGGDDNLRQDASQTVATWDYVAADAEAGGWDHDRGRGLHSRALAGAHTHAGTRSVTTLKTLSVLPA